MNDRGLSEEHLGAFVGEGLYTHVRTSNVYNDLWRKLDSEIGKIFSEYKTNPYLDCALGRWHRWRVPGHDPIDVLKQIIKDPLGRGQWDFGHVFFTDFFTKDGIPILGLSQEYLGKYLVGILKNLGVDNPIKWLNLNGFDYLFGGFSIYNASNELGKALSDSIIDYEWYDYFNTFGSGVFDIYLGVRTSNVLLLGSGIENFVAGSIMLYKDVMMDKAPPTFWERLLDHLPSSDQIIAACGFYLTISTFKNVVYYKLGKFGKDDISRNCLIDISTSLGCFAITKTILPAILGSLSGGLLIPLLIGAGSSTLLRSLFSKIFKKREPITGSIVDLWNKSPLEISSPWSKSPLALEGYWSTSPMQIDSCWSKSPLALEGYWSTSPMQIDSCWSKSPLHIANQQSKDVTDIRNVWSRDITQLNTVWSKSIIQDSQANDADSIEMNFCEDIKQKDK